MHDLEELDMLMKYQSCSFQTWYNEFEKISIPSTAIKVPINVVDYLLDEIIILPKECMQADASTLGYEDDDTEEANEVIVTVLHNE